EVGGVQVGSKRRAVAVNLNRTALQSVPNKIADGKMNVQGQVRPDEGEATGDLRLQPVLFGIQRAEHFRGALAFAVGPLGTGRIGTATVFFRDVGQFRWLPAINRA